MDRIWQWAWDRYRARYSWAMFVAVFATMVWGYLLWSVTILRFQRSTHYLPAVALTVMVVGVTAYLTVLPGREWSRMFEQWAAGKDVDRAKALTLTYVWARGA